MSFSFGLIVLFLGARFAVAAEGIKASASYKADWVSAEGPTHYLGNLDLKADFDAGVLVGIDGGVLHIYGLGNHGGDPTAIVKDLQGTSNIETPVDTFRLYEAYYAQSFLDDGLSVLVGLYDLNSEFYTVKGQGLFLNSSFGVGKELSQTGLNGPSIFPVTAPAMRVKASLPSDVYAQVAVFEGRAGDPGNPYGTHVRIASEDGTLSVAEVGVESGDVDAEAPSNALKAALGCWGYSRELATIEDAARMESNKGCYGMFEHLWTEGFGVFAKYGEANQAVNKYSSGLAVGANWGGLGLGIAQTSLGTPERVSREAAGTSVVGRETAVELTYLWEATPWLNLQPNLQRVLSPAMDATARDVTVTGVRFELHLDF